jgi:hypothetical protein
MPESLFVADSDGALWIFFACWFNRYKKHSGRKNTKGNLKELDFNY